MNSTYGTISFALIYGTLKNIIFNNQGLKRNRFHKSIDKNKM